MDNAADALYLRLEDSRIIESEEVAAGLVLDFNECNEVVGIEMLNLSQRVSAADLREFQYQNLRDVPFCRTQPPEQLRQAKTESARRRTAQRSPHYSRVFGLYVVLQPVTHQGPS